MLTAWSNAHKAVFSLIAFNLNVFKRWREGKGVVQLLIHSENACNSQCLARLKLGARNTIHAPRTCQGGTRAITFFHPCISQSGVWIPGREMAQVSILCLRGILSTMLNTNP